MSRSLVIVYGHPLAGAGTFARSISHTAMLCFYQLGSGVTYVPQFGRMIIDCAGIDLHSISNHPSIMELMKNFNIAFSMQVKLVKIHDVRVDDAIPTRIDGDMRKEQELLIVTGVRSDKTTLILKDIPSSTYVDMNLVSSGWPAYDTPMVILDCTGTGSGSTEFLTSEQGQRIQRDFMTIRTIHIGWMKCVLPEYTPNEVPLREFASLRELTIVTGPRRIGLSTIAKAIPDAHYVSYLRDVKRPGGFKLPEDNKNVALDSSGYTNSIILEDVDVKAIMEKFPYVRLCTLQYIKVDGAPPKTEEPDVLLAKSMSYIEELEAGVVVLQRQAAMLREQMISEQMARGGQ